MSLAAGSHVRDANIDGGSVSTVRVGPMFADELLILDDWLVQPFLETPLTLGTFIACVAHKEGGAHIELGNARLAVLQRCGFLHWPFTAQIAQATVAALTEQFRVEHPGFTPHLP